MRQRRKSIKPVLLILVLMLVSIPTIWLAIVRMEGTAPRLDVELDSAFIGASQTVTVSVEDDGSGVRKIALRLLVEDQEVEILQRVFPSAGFFAGGKENTVRVAAKISPEQMGLADGTGKLQAVAWDYSLRKWGRGNRVELEKEIHIDTQAPAVDLVSRIHNLNQGGSGVAIYKLSEACPTSGVTVGDRFYPGFSGQFDDAAMHMAFFAVHYRQGKGTPITVMARDHAGNQSAVNLPHLIKGRSFRKDTIRLSDGFLNAKADEFKSVFPKASGSPLDRFLKINGELRRKNSADIFQITAQTERRMLWEGDFLRLPRSANRARFADHRTYVHADKVVDRQVHMGIDLASTAQSPVPAANHGKVVFTGDQGIYGDTVIIDHGFGLFSLYAHLSRIDATVGQTVAKGDIIGRTGVTGLAGGDHLHYAMLVHQTYVNPIEWWDAAWIQNNILNKIEEAGAQ